MSATIVVSYGKVSHPISDMMNGDIVEVPSVYLDRIREILPDIIITSAHFNFDGMMNDVVIINDQIVARFPSISIAYPYEQYVMFL